MCACPPAVAKNCLTFIRREVLPAFSRRTNKPLFIYASFDTNVGHFDLGRREHGGHRFDYTDRGTAGALSRMARRA